MQNLNRRTEEQRKTLEMKRKQVLKQYVGGSCILHYCVQNGIHVSWEWSERCLAWRLPLIQDILKKYELYQSTTHGCQVNLRDAKNKLVKKGWKVMTTHKRLAELLDLPCRCQKGYMHGVCEGSMTRQSAYYTKEYAKRFCQGLLYEMTRTQLAQEFQGETQLPKGFGTGAQCVCKELQRHGTTVTCGSCLETNPVTRDSNGEPPMGRGNHQENPESKGKDHQEVFVGDSKIREPKNPKEWDELNRKLYLLHAATGHSSVRNMVIALQKRGVSPVVLEAAKNFRCAVCEERGKVKPRHMASLEPIPPKLSTICADGGTWTHPVTHETVGFVVIVDEGSRFRTAKILSTGKRQTMNASQFLQYLQDGWTQYFGLPATLRLDPAGAFRSHEVEAFCDQTGIYLDIIPAEAHWKFGVCEQAVQGLKEVMNKLTIERNDISPEVALSTAVRVFNEREMVRGYSPIQHVLGRAPDHTGRFISSLDGRTLENLMANPTQEFQDSIALMRAAEQAHSQWNANERIKRALASRAHRKLDFRPGDLVYYWRKQLPKSMEANKNGGFLGPARVLVTETKRNINGELHEGSSVWTIRGRRLLKCTPEQLRHATQREEIIENLVEDENKKAPWTLPRLVSELGKQEYEDITMEKPSHDMSESSQGVGTGAVEDMEVEESLPIPVTRHRTKRPVETTKQHEDEDMDEKLDHGPNKQKRESGRNETDNTWETDMWWNQVTFCDVEEESHSFWSSKQAAIEVAIDMPTTQRGRKQFEQDLAGYFIGALRRRAVEVSEKNMDAETKRSFDEAKQVEVKNYISAKAFEALPNHQKPPKDVAVGMRWILTWKMKDDGTSKPKARAILLGYQDPGYEHRTTTTPVMTRQSRQMLLQVSANRKWKTQKGDVSGAFLQGREYPGQLYCIPCPEICKAMGLEPGSITKVKRGCYGLVDAPIEWYRSVSQYFSKIGLEKMWSDPCTWAWRPGGRLCGLISCHVDDFLFCGDPKDGEWEELLGKIQKEFSWGDWQSGEFTQCGVLIKEKEHGYELSQPMYAEKIKEIPMSASRRKETNAETTDWEKGQLRMILGALSWHAQQVAPHFSAEVGLLLSEISESTVDTVMRANKLVYTARVRKNHVMTIHAFPKDVELGLFMWADAACQNRRGGGSTQGLFLGMGPTSLLDGAIEKITPISWHANKIDRVVRSPGAAEATAAVNGEDVLYHARFQWGEIIGPDTNVFDCDSVVNRVVGVLVSDSRNVYDKLQTEEVTTKGAERRTDLELLCLKHSQRRNRLEVRWVHSEAQLGNALTKANAKELELFYQMGSKWRIVSDENMMSARKRRDKGLKILEHKDDPPCTETYTHTCEEGRLFDEV